MVFMKPIRKKPRCSKCDSLITISVPQDRIGNVYGEEWYCPKCKKDIEELKFNI